MNCRINGYECSLEKTINGNVVLTVFDSRVAKAAILLKKGQLIGQPAKVIKIKDGIILDGNDILREIENLNAQSLQQCVKH